MKKVYVTVHIILESVNFILRKVGFDAALEMLDIFENHEKIEKLNIDLFRFARASTSLKKYPGLSITDASTVAVMKELGIKKVYTLDKALI
ncbi:MAG: PIN domain-containing protein [Candidatus Methanoperedens sp.]|nr:PIN domain-containing protein [Candidatus Methanoperedens sp.]